MSTPPVHTDEGQLLSLARAGDRAAWQTIFERHRDVAYRVAWRVTGNSEDALDVVQEGFIRAYRGLGTFAQASSFRTWLLRIVHRQAIDVRRKSHGRRFLSIDQGTQNDARNVPDTHGDADPTVPVSRAETGIRIAQAIERLPPEQRQAFTLHADGQMTYAEIAEAQGVPIGTVMSRIHYARRKLRELLADAMESRQDRRKEEGT